MQSACVEPSVACPALRVLYYSTLSHKWCDFRRESYWTLNNVYILTKTWCTDYYLFIKYYSPLHISSLKCSFSGGYNWIHAAYGTVTFYESSLWPVGTQLKWELKLWEISLKLGTNRPPRTLIESDSTICCMYTTVSSRRWALEARNM